MMMMIKMVFSFYSRRSSSAPRARTRARGSSPALRNLSRIRLLPGGCCETTERSGRHSFSFLPSSSSSVLVYSFNPCRERKKARRRRRKRRRENARANKNNRPAFGRWLFFCPDSAVSVLKNRFFTQRALSFFSLKKVHARFVVVSEEALTKKPKKQKVLRIFCDG